jgi:hypothetical protein
MRCFAQGTFCWMPEIPSLLFEGFLSWWKHQQVSCLAAQSCNSQIKKEIGLEYFHHLKLKS